VNLCPRCGFVVGGVLCEHVVCETCGKVTEFTRWDLITTLRDSVPVIHEQGGGHHIGELVSDGRYE
jgi:hypothetical protein